MVRDRPTGLPVVWGLARPAVALCLLVALVGCGGQTTVGIDTTGTARLDGTALDMGMVVFTPAGGGEAHSGTIQKDGSFRLHAIPPGRYRVAVQTSMYAGMAAAAEKARGGGGGQPVSMRELEGTFRAVPKKLEDPTTSGIEVDVRPGAPVAIDAKST
jgi:hypothetical protein